MHFFITDGKHPGEFKFATSDRHVHADGAQVIERHNKYGYLLPIGQSHDKAITPCDTACLQCAGQLPVSQAAESFIFNREFLWGLSYGYVQKIG